MRWVFSLSCSEILYEDVGFRSREFAALVASKVFYHLGAFEESLNYALGAGNLFNVNDNSEYVETIIGKASHSHLGGILATHLLFSLNPINILRERTQKTSRFAP